MAHFDRFVLRRLSFDGPKVEPRFLSFGDGLNIVWGASNAGKSFIVKALDFMAGGGSLLPNIKERRGYERCQLELDVPKSGRILLTRSLSGGGFELDHIGPDAEITQAQKQTLAATHGARSESLSSFLLKELGISDKKIARTQDGTPTSFTFRHLAPYIFTEETPMMAEQSPIKIDPHTTETFDKNVLKFILTGVDDHAIVATTPVREQKTLNLGKIEIVGELFASSLAELQRMFPNDDVKTLDLNAESERIAKTSTDIAETLAVHQSELDRMRRERRARFDGREEARARAAEVILTVDRFALLAEVYDSDVQRLLSLEEGAAALLAGSKRPCPLCGAIPEHQRDAHGLDKIEHSQQAARAEIAKIGAERIDLAKASASLDAEAKGLETRDKTLTEEIAALDRAILETRPREVAARTLYEDLDRVRQRNRDAIALKSRVDSLATRRLELLAFRPARRPRDQIATGIGGIVGYEFAQDVSAILAAWHFPGPPIVAFEDKTHDILIDGKDRQSNGKGVRALLNAEFKLAVLSYCRRKNLPHPGVVVLDSPLVTYRDPHTSKYGELADDEQRLKGSSVRDGFYEYLLNQSDQAQFIVIENDPPPFVFQDRAKVVAFAGPGGEGTRQGLF